jgi:hypothetical protein
MPDQTGAPAPHVVSADPAIEEVASAHLRSGGGLLRPAAAGASANFGQSARAVAVAAGGPDAGEGAADADGAPGQPAVAPAAGIENPPARTGVVRAAPPSRAAGSRPVSQVRAAPLPGRVPRRDPGWHRPVFVLAPARSNSSVVSSIIGMHPELYGFPELSLFRAATVAGLIDDRPGQRGLPARARTAGLARAVAQVHDGRQDEESVAAARKWLAERKNWDVALVFDHLLERVAPAIGFEKSPENSNREDYLQRLAASYPRARFLHVTRHPVTTATSMHRVWSKADLWEIPEEMFHLHVLGTWLFNHGRVKRFTAALPPDRWMRVRSEDVLNSPETTLPAICRWLGIDAGPEAIEAMLHPERSPFARLGPSNAMGGNDPGFLEQPTVRRADLPATLELPPEWIVDPWLHVSVVEFAASIGYREGGG